MTIPLYIFDLDGTIALIDHRRHLIENKSNQQWAEFHKACVNDKPNLPVINLCTKLWISNADIMFFSGRSDIVRNETESWLRKHIPFLNYYEKAYKLDYIKMRQEGDYTADESLKRRWYEHLCQENKDRLECVFDDRQKVVDMWRSMGITCLQVARGDF